MALDLYAGSHAECIAPQDEYLLQLAAEEADRFPQLNALWSAFYDDPRMAARQAGDAAHEILVLLTHGGGALNPALLRRGVALATFFSSASREGLDVRGISD